MNRTRIVDLFVRSSNSAINKSAIQITENLFPLFSFLTLRKYDVSDAFTSHEILKKKTMHSHFEALMPVKDLMAQISKEKLIELYAGEKR